MSSANVGTQFNELSGVTAVSPTDVWAVGHSETSGIEQTLTEHWNGTSWSVVTSPNPSASQMSWPRLRRTLAPAWPGLW